jgi:hypothetical protein
VTGYEPGDRVEVDDEPGTVITSDDERTIVELEDRTIDVPTSSVDPRSEVPDEDTEDGSHEWAEGMDGGDDE